MCPRMALVCFVSRSKTDYKSVSMFLGKQRLLRSALAERISMFFLFVFFVENALSAQHADFQILRERHDTGISSHSLPFLTCHTNPSKCKKKVKV